ncbi:MAG: T9SS type A sorting domain-containing protein [Candidatus Eisenbacteria bacterium]|uniref:T9SS type A sorting domain-containing protein n=1 Tax=Eiseniibacteriota bacterium TaxID=2212470 RepID=A0A956SEU3_UNCEI|nr:T9SS type A sorting domain-containing protein [Candidatus Eisenbacteria bacterium]
MTRTLTRSFTLSLVPCLAAMAVVVVSPTASSAAIELASLQRSITVFGSIAPLEGEGQFDSDNDNVSHTGPYDNQLDVLVEYGDSFAQTTAFQTSFHNDGGSIFATGGFDASAGVGTSAQFSEALGATNFRYQFSVDQETHARLVGFLEATGLGRASITIVGSGGFETYYRFVENERFDVDETFVLNPGGYQMTIDTNGFGQAFEDRESPGTGEFEIAFAPLSPASVETPALLATAPTVSPNPVSSEAQIQFRNAIPEGRDVEIIAANGRAVRSLGPVSGANLTWDTRDELGALVPAGVYFVRVQGETSSTRTVVIR